MDQGEEARRFTAGLGAARAYELVRKELLGEFGADFFRSYIDPLRLVAEMDGVLLFRTGSRVAQERLRQQVQHRLEARMRAYVPNLGPTEILLEHEIPDDVRALADARIEPVRTAPAADALRLPPLSFENFCVDETNQRAFAVAQMLASGATVFPTWLVHSPPGCGKTHLLTAIAREATAQGRKVLMLTGQEFLEQFQSALHKKRDSSVFKDMVRAPDVLIIDDFHRICGKKATEEEAFDSFYDVTRRGGQVILAANHGAEGLEGLDDTLRAKLKGAAASEITEPGASLRRRILDQRVAFHARATPGFSVAPEALDMIAERMHVTGRELDGAVCQLLIEWKISGGTIVTLDAAATALQNKLSDAAERRITVQLVQKVVARHYNMTPAQLLERTRRHAIARPRQVAMYLACKMTHASLPDIGQRFGGFDHTTIMYARDRIAALAETDANLKAELENVARAIRREP
ncbi:MAG TPA: DnaA/Hda family protein [Vitreimonas sp.]|uniref:DnaA ATPase domain-containing protein n=1 Tax=Vitreimonas sp. TaxID=3069702 RepID=UPI002D30BC0F|nr:DnaA/Hda family protein [Vitreimonas sp.]HYD87405.1 DnaA/Hda family protein [Vitreimonas sp.]